MLGNTRKIFVFGSVFLILCIEGCGKTKTSGKPAPTSVTPWDGQSDKNTSDLSFEEVEP